MYQLFNVNFMLDWLLAWGNVISDLVLLKIIIFSEAEVMVVPGYAVIGSCIILTLGEQGGGPLLLKSHNSWVLLRRAAYVISIF